MSAPHDLLSQAAAARYLGVSVSSLERWRAQGIGPKVTWIGRRPKYRRRDLDEYATRGERR
jgi:hypothetical protein